MAWGGSRSRFIKSSGPSCSTWPMRSASSSPPTRESSRASRKLFRRTRRGAVGQRDGALILLGASRLTSRGELLGAGRGRFDRARHGELPRGDRVQGTFVYSVPYAYRLP